MDGFVSRGKKSSDTDIKSRFRQNYRPKDDDFSVGKSVKADGFVRRETRGKVDQEIPELEEIVLDEPDTKNFVGFESEEQQLKGRAKRKAKRAEKKRKKKEKRAKEGKFKKVARATAIFLLATLIGVGALFGYGYWKARNVFQGGGEGALALQDNVDPTQLKGEGDGRVNILISGRGGEGHDGADLTDTLILASIDPIHKEVGLVSVPRDLWVENEVGGANKINQQYIDAKNRYIYSNGDSDESAAEQAGIDALNSTIADVLGVPVHYYIMIDFKSFEKAIDTVGGITIDVKDPVAEQMYFDGVPYYLNVQPGLQEFDGFRALAYSRCRHCDARSDFGRSDRQREVIIAMQKKVLSLGTFSNPFKVIELLNDFEGGVRTDISGLSEVKRMTEIMQEVPDSNILSLTLTDPVEPLITSASIPGTSAQMPRLGLFQYDEIHSFVRNELRDGYLRQEDARVVILNGTTRAGLATATMEELESYGYNIVRVDNAPTSNYVQNKLIDNTGMNEYTRTYLEKRLGLTATSQSMEGLPTAEEADFVIILGTDEISSTTN